MMEKREGAGTIEPLIIKTYHAAAGLRRASDKQIQAALKTLASLLEEKNVPLLKANASDLSRQDPDNPKNDRLMLNKERIGDISRGIRQVCRLPDPTGKVLEKRKLKNGLHIQKISVPL